MQEKSLAFAHNHPDWNKGILEEKKKMNKGISNFPILSNSLFARMPSCSIKAHHATHTTKAKAATTFKKKEQPKSGKLPITSRKREVVDSATTAPKSRAEANRRR